MMQVLLEGEKVKRGTIMTECEQCHVELYTCDENKSNGLAKQHISFEDDH